MATVCEEFYRSNALVPPPNCPDKWDYWTSSPSEEVELMCLLPNSIYVSMRTSWDATLQDVKEDLWARALQYPLYGMLREISEYVFRFINSLADLEEVDDETKRIRDVRPTLGVLMIIERSVERPGERLLDTHISHLIGRGLNEFDNLQSSEVNDFRIRMRTHSEESMIKRSQSTGLKRLRYQCPPRLAKKPDTPETLKKYLINNYYFYMITRVANTEFRDETTVAVDRTPREHIEKILYQLDSKHMRGKPDDYVVKVSGRKEYLFDNKPFIQFLYIQETLYTSDKPQVTIVNLNTLPLSPDYDMPSLPERCRLASDHSITMRRREHESSWTINWNYRCTILRVTNLNVEPGKTVEVVCQAGIFHGGQPLCESQKVAVTSCGGIAEWEQELNFPIKVYNLPRRARLCFGIYLCKSKGKRNKKDVNKEAINKLAWANTQIFDYKDQLRTDEMTLHMWTHVADDAQSDDRLLHPLGTVVSNPNTDSCAELQLRFSNYGLEVPIMFPRQDVVRAYSENIESPYVLGRLNRDFERLRTTAEEDPMYEMHEQDKKDIWAARELFRQDAPELLPKMLACVEWGDRAEVSSVSRMLPHWPKFKRVESALELLDYAYADAGVRSFAVKCLENMSDGDILLYLLQLVQTLKHEPYLMCDFAVFLLKRAFKNMTIGHYLFWHLRSEMHVPSLSLRFGLMLEAYCRGAQDHINSLMRQITCLDKLKWVSKTVGEQKEISKARAALLEHLQERHCAETLCDFVSPLNPSFVCKKIKLEKCNVMDSKMRPLMLDFENEDMNGKNIRIILKIGDDLRQDMLTLQVLRIMDSLWKSEGYDFRLNPYNCISLDNAVGMIEVVPDATTVAKALKENAFVNATSSLQQATLLQWIRNQTKGDEVAFNRAIEEFTLSCAGYCVATYVLGIADRHSDNIMITKNGQLFHIDFGHFLGHFKHKFGIKREHVAFVLTGHLIHVINKGDCSGTKTAQVTKFKDNCEKAFMILRKHGHLILSLFSMMIFTGLPELSSEKDLQYLRETLVLDLPDDKAIEHFKKKFDDALKNSWTTLLNWICHDLDKNMRRDI